MCPVEDGVSYSFSEAFCKCKELLFVGSISCDIFLFDTERSHETPFIMISAEPNLSDVVEMLIFGNLSGIDVAVIVKYGHFRSVVVIKCLSGFTL